MQDRHDIILRSKANDSLSLDEMRARLPAIFADEAHESRSGRYVFVSTEEVLTELIAHGFVPVEARVSRSRDEGRRAFTKHMVRFRARDDLAGGGERRVGDTSYEVLLRNAHDGTAAYEFLAGLLRLICTNGLVVSDGTIASVKVRHAGNRQQQLEHVAQGALTVLEQGPRVMQKVREWKDIDLVPVERELLAQAAHTARFADADGEVKTPIRPAQLLIPRRPADSGNDLWSTFNVLQENAVRGGLSARGYDSQNRVRRMTTREVRGIDGDIKLNKALWQITEHFAKLKREAGNAPVESLALVEG